MASHVVLPGSARARKGDAVRIGDVSPSEHVQVTVTVKGPDLPEPVPGKPLSRDAFERDYAADPETMAMVSQGLTNFGLEVTDVSPVTRSMHVSGTAEQMEAAFQSGLGTYRSATQGEYRGREGKVQIPAKLAGLITGVFGLDQRQVVRRKATDPRAGGAAADLTQPVSAADLESHYNFPDGDGSGHTVAIAEFGGAYFADDLTAYCQKQQSPVPVVTGTGVNGAPVLTLDDIRRMDKQQRNNELMASIEVNMDVQIVAGLCPAAAITVYFADFTQQGWVDLINEVIGAQPAPVALSVSWGAAEDSPDWSQSALQEINGRLQAASLLGITVSVAAGDDGSGDAVGDSRAHVDFPGSSPYVLSVGGTMLDNGTDVVWWETPGQRTQNGGGATGGGVSVEFPRPPWQNVTIASINPGSIDGRVVPDIAALAGPPLYDLIFLGKDMPNGGTSAAAPTWASLVARMAASTTTPWTPSFLTPLIYQSIAAGETIGSAGCVDVTSGHNISPTPGTGYSAGPGFDAVSGWGVPDGAALLAALLAAAPAAQAAK